MTAAGLALFALGGAAFGALHLGALWLSTRALARPGGARLFALGAAVRLALVLAALAGALAAAPSWRELAAAALGFAAVRLAATRAAARPEERRGRAG
jgi:F1F0 ATPase subunit 2